MASSPKSVVNLDEIGNGETQLLDEFLPVFRVDNDEDDATISSQPATYGILFFSISLRHNSTNSVNNTWKVL